MALVRITSNQAEHDAVVEDFDKMDRISVDESDPFFGTIRVWTDDQHTDYEEAYIDEIYAGSAVDGPPVTIELEDGTEHDDVFISYREIHPEPYRIIVYDTGFGKGQTHLEDVPIVAVENPNH